MIREVLGADGEIYKQTGGCSDGPHDIIGRTAVDFYKPALEEMRAILQVTHDEKYAVASFVEKVTTSHTGISVQFYIVRAKHRISAWALRDVVSQFTQSVADLLNEWGYKPKDAPRPSDSIAPFRSIP